MKKKATCEACGTKFELKKENKYLADKTVNIFGVGNIIAECFDCPSCGCQFSANIRMPRHEENQEPKKPTTDRREDVMEDTEE